MNYFEERFPSKLNGLDNFSPEHIWILEAIHARIIFLIPGVRLQMLLVPAVTSHNVDRFDVPDEKKERYVLLFSQQIDTVFSWNFRRWLLLYLCWQLNLYSNQHYVVKNHPMTLHLNQNELKKNNKTKTNMVWFRPAQHYVSTSIVQVGLIYILKLDTWSPRLLIGQKVELFGELCIDGTSMDFRAQSGHDERDIQHCGPLQTWILNKIVY